MIVGVGAGRGADPGSEGRRPARRSPDRVGRDVCAPAQRGARRLRPRGLGEHSPEDAAGLLARGDVRLANAHSLEAAGAMCGVISPSMACWAARDEVNGGVGYSPFNDGPGEAFWLGLGTPAAIERQRIMAEGIAPGFAAALRADGPIDAFALCAQGIAMGDDCHMRHQATTMLLLRQVLPAMAERAPQSVAPTARMLGATATSRSPSASPRRAPRSRASAGRPIPAWSSSSAATEVEAAVQIAGLAGPLVHLPGAVGGRPALPPGFLRCRRGTGHRRLGARGVRGSGRRGERGQPERGGVPGRRAGGGDRADPLHGRHLPSPRSERLRIPTLDGEGTPLGRSVRAPASISG